jgi:hypothetical protein
MAARQLTLVLVLLGTMLALAETAWVLAGIFFPLVVIAAWTLLLVATGRAPHRG